MPCRGCGTKPSGRCGERTERCQWQRERSERVAAVKILSVRRKAAQKFWAPQQDHRPLRTAWWLVRRADVGIGPYGRFDKKVPYVESPSHGFAVPASFRQGDRGDGLPQPVTSVTGFAMTYYKECIGRADVGVGPYGSVTRGAMGGRPQGSPLRRVTSSTGGGPMWASAPTGGLARKCLRRIPQSRLCRASPL